MKFGNTGRDITDKKKFMTKPKKSDFLERFKGRTSQISTDGHLGIVKNTHTPIKPVHSGGMDMYNNHNQNQMNGGNMMPMGNHGGYSSSIGPHPTMKKSNSLSGEAFQTRNSRYSSFAQNHQKVDNSYKESQQKQPHKRSLANIGGHIMGGSMKSLHEYPKMHSSKTNIPNNAMRESTLSYQKDINIPNSSKENPSNHNFLLRQNIQYMGKGKNNHQKTNFYSSKQGSMDHYGQKGSSSGPPMRRAPYPSSSFSGGNSDGFTHTSVSTPHEYQNANFNRSKGQKIPQKMGNMNAQLSTLRRSIQNDRQGYPSLSHTHKPEDLKFAAQNAFRGSKPSNNLSSTMRPQKNPKIKKCYRKG
ncbi:unnamed protein product [Moneuplotes crassus]|uniref:Uncharacterized protein n=2 Tax=Euplotes crassus TaxID=5936 RepID=A0AAD1XFU0_EUPCR|nr:unnamed protein product [Moneuplotes crassus]